MALRLFEHNEKVYHAAVRMMEQYGKAAIVHPTGTGKSYIARNDPWRSSRQGCFAYPELCDYGLSVPENACKVSGTGGQPVGAGSSGSGIPAIILKKAALF